MISILCGRQLQSLLHALRRINTKVLLIAPAACKGTTVSYAKTVRPIPRLSNNAKQMQTKNQCDRIRETDLLCTGVSPRYPIVEKLCSKKAYGPLIIGQYRCNNLLTIPSANGIG